MSSFDDHFSRQARDYARYRPRYPAALFEYLADLAPARRLAWDVGTGNGQAALALAEQFDHVVATDASAEQLSHATAHERVEYRVARAEAVALPPRSVDLVTAAIAIHWFDLDAFYATVRRVAAPGAILAAWTYHLPTITPAVDALIARYYRDILAGYWAPQIAHIEAHYRTLPFPYEPVAPPPFEMEAEWGLDELLGFLDSWSAVQRYRQEQGDHPARRLWPELERAWGDAAARPVRWALHMRVGRVAP